MAGQRGRTSEQGARRRAAGRPAAPAAPPRGPGAAAIPVLLAVALPSIGAAIDEASGPGMGAVFALCTVLGTGAAAAVCTRNGWWWVLACSPVVILAVTAGAELLGDNEKYKGNGLATGSAKWVVHGFPVMAQALVVAVLVITVRTIRSRRRQHG